MTHPLQQRIAGWSLLTFGVTDLPATIRHLAEEINEAWGEVPEWGHDPLKEELADCLILTCKLASAHGVDLPLGAYHTGLLTYARAKMDENERREWAEPDEHGVRRHIETGAE